MTLVPTTCLYAVHCLQSTTNI